MNVLCQTKAIFCRRFVLSVRTYSCVIEVRTLVALGSFQTQENLFEIRENTGLFGWRGAGRGGRGQVIQGTLPSKVKG